MTKFINRTSKLTEFPFQDYAVLEAAELEAQAEEHQLRTHNIWMLPQMLAHFGNWRVRIGSSGLLDAAALGRDNIGNDAWSIGLWKVATKLRRSSLVKTQNNPQFSGYSALVPLILAGIKKHQNLNYSEWDPQTLSIMVDSALYDAMTCQVPDNLTLDDILHVRHIGLQVKSGSRMGELNNPLSTWKLTGIKQTLLGDLPVLAQTMLAQIWVAHPTLRSKYMVLDPRDWDRMPEYLISTDVVPNTAAKSFHHTNTLPWL